MAKVHPLAKAAQEMMIKEVPSYGNKFFYSLGFLSMISFMLLIITGVFMTFYGPTWWLTDSIGRYTRSVHLWATQAFVIFIILHMLIVFLTSGFKKPRRLTWVLGVLMLFVVLAETEFGYVLRGDFSSQWRGLQGADFYNGGGIGRILNPLNYNQIFGIHIVIIPLVIIGLLFMHYLLVRILGIAKPYKSTISVKTVPANHKLLLIRGIGLVALVLLLAALLPSPYIKPTTIQSIAKEDPVLIGKTLAAEFANSSDTATYKDNIDPYTFDTKAVYIAQPYQNYISTQPNVNNDLQTFNSLPEDIQAQQLKELNDYYDKDKVNLENAPNIPAFRIVKALTLMAQTGLYEPIITEQSMNKTDSAMYTSRFLADSGVLEEKATALNITTDQYGMIREESGITPGAWWLAPIGILNHTVLANDDNGDRDAAIIFGSLLITMIAFPFIPYVNQIPDKLKLYIFIWREKK